MSLATTFKSARRAGVPLVMVETPDGASAQSVILRVTPDNTPVTRWDMVRGLCAVTEAANSCVSQITDGDPASVNRPDELFERLKNFDESGIILFYGAEKILGESFVRQGLWNMRDTFKERGQTAVLFVPVGTKLSNDLKDDFIVLDHNLPEAEDLAKIATKLREDANLAPLSETDTNKAVDATLGLSEFAAEQVIAMAMTREGLDHSTLWDRKRKAIEGTNGLKVWKGAETFDKLGGLENAKRFFKAYVKGKQPPRCIVFIDEIEKQIGTQQDTSGTSQSMLGSMLSWMEDKDITGCLLVGVAGSGKTAISKALGNEAGCPTIQFDLSGMKGSLVGSSEQNLRSAMATVDAIGQGRVMVLATCNSMANLPPELKRRFKFSTMFFDLPSKEERQGIWKLYLEKFGLTGTIPNDTDWTGAEVRTCCQIADQLQIPLTEAAAYIVPVAKSGKDAIAKLRTEANGNYISASYSGVYQLNEVKATTTPNRVIKIEE